MHRLLLKNQWWIVCAVALVLLVAHTLDWKPVKVDSTSLILLGIVLLSPLMAGVRRIRFGDFEAEIDPQEVSRVRDEVKAHLGEADTEEHAAGTPPYLHKAVTSLQELVGKDHILALANLRMEMEKGLRRLYKLAHPGDSDADRLSAGRLVHKLRVTDVIEPGLLSPLEEVLCLCHRVVHGENIRPHDAREVVGMGTSLLRQLHGALSWYAPEPKEREHITPSTLEQYRRSVYRVVTVLPHAETPMKHVYVLNREGLDQLLERYDEQANLIVGVEPVDGAGEGDTRILPPKPA